LWGGRLGEDRLGRRSRDNKSEEKRPKVDLLTDNDRSVWKRGGSTNTLILVQTTSRAEN